MNIKPFLTVIVPVYNEKHRIGKGIKEILNYLKKQRYNWELVIIDDGSSDNTVEIAQKMLKGKNNVKLVKNQHTGKGGAIRKGVALAKGEWLIFLDIDLATPMKELEKFLPFTKAFDVIIGSRKIKGAQIEVRQPKFREFGGKVFTWLTNTLVTKNISDVTCGFKLFKTNLAKELFSKSVLVDWSFDAEILYLAQKANAKIKEVPVRWRDDPNTKVNLMKDTLDAFFGLLKIRTNDFRGIYD